MGYTPISKALHLKYHQIDLMKSSLFRCFSLHSVSFHHEVDKLKTILYKNSYPRDLAYRASKNMCMLVHVHLPCSLTIHMVNDKMHVQKNIYCKDKNFREHIYRVYFHRKHLISI